MAMIIWHLVIASFDHLSHNRLLFIVFTQLESISGICDSSKTNAPSSSSISNDSKNGVNEVTADNHKESPATNPPTVGTDTIDADASVVDDTSSSVSSTTAIEVTEVASAVDTPPIGVKACEDARYRKYFKMNQFGVPLAAVKLKMEAEGFDSNILE